MKELQSDLIKLLDALAQPFKRLMTKLFGGLLTKLEPVFGLLGRATAWLGGYFRRYISSHIPEPYRTKLRKGLVGGLVVYLLVATLTGLGIYLGGWQNGFTKAVSYVVPYPAAVAAGQVISYRSYIERADYTKAYLIRANKGNLNYRQQEINHQAIGELVSAAFVDKAAKDRNILVTNDELDSELEKIYITYGGADKALLAAKQNYGLSSAGYRQLVAQQIKRAKVEAALMKDSAMQEISKAQAKSYIEAAKAGENFTNMAANFSASVTSVKPSEPALFYASQLPEEVAGAIKAAKDGELIGEPITADATVYVVKREKVEGKEILARVLMVRPPSFTNWLDLEIKKNPPLKLLGQLR
jgi:hypothetical protein